MSGEIKAEFLYLTTTGRRTGLPRQTEIWFVSVGTTLFILAEHLHATQWVKNLQIQPRVHVRIGNWESDATARVLDKQQDEEAWNLAQKLAREKYGWGEGLPVELVPLAPV